MSFGVEDALNQVKKCKYGDDSNHVKRLYEVTLAYRRYFIENEWKNVAKIMKEFPHLKLYSIVSVGVQYLYLFFNLTKYFSY